MISNGTLSPNPEAGGTLSCLLNGTEGQQMMDNLCIDSHGRIIIQEDPGNNAYLHWDAATGRFTIVPWDMNLALSGFGGGRMGPGGDGGGEVVVGDRREAAASGEAGWQPSEQVDGGLGPQLPEQVQRVGGDGEDGGGQLADGRRAAGAERHGHHGLLGAGLGLLLVARRGRCGGGTGKRG